jgi:hypothetical protein
MRRLSCLAGAVLLLWPAIGCDSDDPTQIGEQTLAVGFNTTNAVASQFDVWDVFRDRNCLPDADPATPTPAELQCATDADCMGIVGFSGVCGSDGVADDLSFPPDGTPDVFVFCEQALDTGGNPIQSSVQNVPWNFSVQIRVLRDGETVKDAIVTSPNVGSNLTPYDDFLSTVIVPACPAVPITGVPCPDPGNAFFYSNPRRRSQASREVVDSNVFTIPGTLQPACPGEPQGDSGINGQNLPISIRVNKGDTVLVDARKTDGQTIPILNEPTLAATVTLDGSQVQPDGVVVSDAVPGAGISFFFTVR